MLYNYATGIISLTPPIAQKDLHSALALAEKKLHFYSLFEFAFNFPITLPFDQCFLKVYFH